MDRRVPFPFSMQREKSRHSQLIERLIPAPASVGDDAGDQGVEIDFPGSSGASRAAF